jgi:hypothetical protein
MSRNTETVETYLDGFRRNDHAQILSCLTDDIEWTVFGAFRLTGKQAYDAAIEGPGFVGPHRRDGAELPAPMPSSRRPHAPPIRTPLHDRSR